MKIKKVKTQPEMFTEMVKQCRRETEDLHKLVARLMQGQSIPADNANNNADNTLQMAMVVNGLIQDVSMLTTRIHYLERELDYLRASRKGDICS